MARPSLFHHRKFRTLARLVRSRAVAAGSLELIWAVANDAGDPLIGTAADVEDIADWRGRDGALAAALVAAGFLDETPDGLVVHDHAHHCPSYVRRRREREHSRRGTDAPAARQRPASDAPLTPTPNSQLPTPISQHPTPTLATLASAREDRREAPREVDPTTGTEGHAVWQAWTETAAEVGKTEIKLLASWKDGQSARQLGAAYPLAKLKLGMRAFWASPYVNGRNFGLFASMVAEAIAHGEAGHPYPLRAPTTVVDDGLREQRIKRAGPPKPWPGMEPRA